MKLIVVRAARLQNGATGHSFCCDCISPPQDPWITAGCLPLAVPFQQCALWRGASFVKNYICLSCTFFSLYILFSHGSERISGTASGFVSPSLRSGVVYVWAPACYKPVVPPKSRSVGRRAQLQLGMLAPFWLWGKPFQEFFFQRFKTRKANLSYSGV